jgi:predicted dehydrogenase
LSWLMGDQPARSISAAVARRLEPASPVEDLALCRFAFERGFGQINMAWGSGPGGIEIMGSDGRLLLFYATFGSGPFVPPEQLHVYRGYERVPLELDTSSSLGMREVIRDFVDSIQEGREPRASGAAGCAVLEAVLGGYASAARGRTVSLPLDRGDPIFEQGLSAVQDAAEVR